MFWVALFLYYFVFPLATIFAVVFIAVKAIRFALR